MYLFLLFFTLVFIITIFKYNFMNKKTCDIIQLTIPRSVYGSGPYDNMKPIYNTII